MTRTMAPAGAHQHVGYQVACRTMNVTDINQLTPSVRQILLADPDGSPLAGFEPGSHLILDVGGYRNAYSLVGDGVNPYRYGISVLRRGVGRGSDWIHDNLVTGASIIVEGPRSHFAPVTDQTHALLVAGGIGITAILSHALAARRWGRPAEVVYSYRPGSAAHIEDVRELAASGGITLFEATSRAELTSLLGERLGVQPLGTHAYACGPMGLLETYLQLGTAAGWPRVRLHLEHFDAPAQAPGSEFTVTIASTGEQITVPSGVSLLDRLHATGQPVPFLCRQGVCGECSIPVRSGTIEHRDLVLSTAERGAADRMLCCVSRGENLELDL